MNGDGNLNLVAGNFYQVNRLYRSNMTRVNTARTVATSLAINAGDNRDIFNATLFPLVTLPPHTHVDYYQ